MDEQQAYTRVKKVLAIDGEIRCKVCGQPIAGRCVLCAACETPHHQDCWSYSGGCSVFGCRKAESFTVPVGDEPKVELKRRALPYAVVASVLLLLSLAPLGIFWATAVHVGPHSAPLPPSALPPYATLPPPVAPAPASRPSVTAPLRRITPPTTEGIPLDFVFAGGQPATPQDIIKSAFPEGGGELKMISISMTPIGAYIATLPAIGNTGALGGARVRVHLALPVDPPWRESLVARPVLEDWTYQGRETPLPAMGSRPLEETDRLAWDVTALAGERPVRVAIVPHAPSFETIRELKALEGRAIVWMSVGEPVPPPPRVTRALPDLAITGMKLEGDQILVYFENRGSVSRDGTFDMKLGADGRGPLGCSNAPLKVPAPGAESVARFRSDSLKGAVKTPGRTLVSAEVDWTDAIPEADEANNVGTRELDLP